MQRPVPAPRTLGAPRSPAPARRRAHPPRALSRSTARTAGTAVSLGVSLYVGAVLAPRTPIAEWSEGQLILMTACYACMQRLLAAWRRTLPPDDASGPP